MKYNELFEVDFKENLVDEISSIDLRRCSYRELVLLKGHLAKIKEHADILTLEDELVGYVYSNLYELMLKIKIEESKKLVKLPTTKVS